MSNYFSPFTFLRFAQGLSPCHLSPLFALAPMATITDLPFRRVCQNLGCNWAISEMVNVRPDLFKSSLNRLRIDFLKTENNNFPKIVQLVGSDPNLIAEVAQVMERLGADVIDINMGCPAKKVGKQNAGSALLIEPDKVKLILNKVVNAVKIPVSLKTRIGFDENNINIDYIAKLAEDCGIKLIAIHGRTRSQKFKGKARYEEIATVKQNLKIPVIVNGDIDTAEKANYLIKSYNFDGVMIGRAAIGNPFIFAELTNKIITNQQKQELILNHILELHNFYPDQLHAQRIARTHLLAYYKNHPNFNKIKELINNSNMKQQIEIIKTNLF